MRYLYAIVTVTLAGLLLLVAGCGSSRDSAGGAPDSGGVEAAALLGLTNCATCHNAATAVTDDWLDSRHGNRDDSPNTTDTRCTPCHDPNGQGQIINQAIAAETPAPRMVIDCEACHGGGQFHFGTGPLPYPVPGPNQCGQCHGLDGQELFHSSNAIRNISDTHYDNPTTADSIEGYNVRNANQEGCVECHFLGHAFDLTVNDEWGRSAHAGGLLDIKDAASTTDTAARKAVGFTGPQFAGRDFATSSDGACARCHTSTGGANFLNDPFGYSPAQNNFSYLVPEQKELIYCWVCHVGSDAGLRDPGTMLFPSGASASLPDGSNVCMGCHSGRESGLSIDSATPNDVVQSPDYPSYDFVNIHYYAAAATFFGSDVTAGYEYTGQTYRGQNPYSSHGGSLDTCIACHLAVNANEHDFTPAPSDCGPCHSGSSFETLSGSPSTNYNAITALSGDLLTAIQNYASANLANWVVYDSSAYPYFFIDTNQNGIADPGEISFGNRFRDFDLTLLRAAYNYQVAQKDPCGYIHNGIYIRQILYDSVIDLGGTTGQTRP